MLGYIVQITTAVVYCLLSSGIIFGYAALKAVLVATLVYRSLCSRSERHDHVPICYAQDMRLNLMFVTAAVGTNVAALPNGYILDRYGPRVCSVLGSVLLGLGATLLSFASWWAEDGWDVYIPGYLALALGGSCIFISSMHLANAFPRHQGLILALLTGAFDSSSAVFLGYRMLYQVSDGWVKPSRFFALYLLVPGAILLAQLLWMPSKVYKTVGELVQQAETVEADLSEHTALLPEARHARNSVVGEITDLLGSKHGRRQKEEERQKHRISGVWGAMHGRPLKTQLCSPWFILIALMTMLQMTRINWFMATVRQQYTYLLGSYEQGVEINTFFDIALPLGGVLSIPLIGLILDHLSTFTVSVILVAGTTLIGILGVLPHRWAAYANISLFVLYRPLYYTTISDYTAKVFGFDSFGTVYGMIICLAGLFSFVQSSLDAITYKWHRGNPIPVNLGLLAAGVVVGGALAGWVGSRARSLQREQLVAEAEAAPEFAMPGAEE